MTREVQCEVEIGWAPTFSDFAELIRLVNEGEISCSHTAFGCWSFWRPGGRHAVIDVHCARFYLRQPFGAGASWADRHSVLDALNISDWLDLVKEDEEAR